LAARFVAEDLTRIAEALPDYEVERELGRGGMGVVLRAHHRRLGRAVAIKELPQTFASEPDIRDRFTTEARTLATLAHPHIVPVYDYVERGALCLIVMEELPGGTVWERFTTIGLTAPAACAITLACCAALQHAHDKGVLHLDVKPDNLMFDGSGTIKVTDFGISRVISGDRLLATVDGQVLGTPAYMSPEQARGESLDASSDVYSAGVMLYELLSGRLPWSGAESASELLIQRLEEEPKPLREFAPHVPVVISDVVMRAIERDRERRYKRAEDLGVALASACAQAWGPLWLDHAGVLLIGSDRLSMAARTTTQQPPAPAAPAAAGDAAVRATGGTAAPGTIISPSEGARASDTVHSGEISGEMSPAQATIGPAPAAAAAAPPSTPAPAAPAPPADPEADLAAMPVVRAAAAEPRIRGADLNVLRRGDLVEMKESLRKPPFPRVTLVLGVVFLLAAVIVAAVMFGADGSEGDLQAGQVFLAEQDVTGDEPVQLDLSKDVAIAVATPGPGSFSTEATLELSTLGVPLGSLDTRLVDGLGVFEPKIVEHLAAGNVRAELVLTGDEQTVATQEFDVEATNAWYATALGVVGIALVLAGVANLESNLRNLRQRRRTLSVIGAGIAGVLMAIGITAILTALGIATPTLPGVIAAAALSAIGVACTAVALGVLARRRRVDRAVKRAVRNLGVSVSKN
jgi:serine/threonine-protein kinase